MSYYIGRIEMWPGKAHAGVSLDAKPVVIHAKNFGRITGNIERGRLWWRIWSEQIPFNHHTTSS